MAEAQTAYSGRLARVRAWCITPEIPLRHDDVAAVLADRDRLHAAAVVVGKYFRCGYLGFVDVARVVREALAQSKEKP